MMKPVQSALVALTVASLGLTAACSGSANSPTNSGGAAVSNATFVYDTFTSVMTGWDPSTSYANEIIAMNNMYETLTRYDSATQTIKPLLATSWSPSDGGKTWTFQLRHGVTFHTGRPMDAAAAKAAIERTIHLNKGAAYIWGAVKSINTPSPYTLVFHLKYATPLDLVSASDYAAYVYDTKAAGSSSLAKWFGTGKDAGTGPYTVQSWKQGQEVELTLQSYPKYWGGWSGAHYRRVMFRDVPQATTAAKLLQSGEVSYVEQLTPQLWTSLAGNSSINRPQSASWENFFLFYNTANGPLQDIRLRKAVSYGINYDGILAALKGAATRTPGIVPKGLVGYSSSLPQYTYDPTKAKELLAETGYGPGKRPLDLTMTYTIGAPNEEISASLIKSSLASLNVNLTVKALQWPTQVAQAQSADVSKRQDIFAMYWWPDYADPYSWFINLFHTEKTPVNNLSYYSNPLLDRQIDKVEAIVATDKPAAEKLYEQMQRELYQQAPAVVLSTANYQRGLLSSVSGFVDNPAYPNVVFAYDLHPAGR